MTLRRPESSFPNARARPFPFSLCVGWVRTGTLLAVLRVAHGVLEACRVPLPLPPTIAVSVPDVAQLLECALGAAINTELINIAATTTKTVLPIPFAFMTCLPRIDGPRYS